MNDRIFAEIYEQVEIANIFDTNCSPIKTCRQYVLKVNVKEMKRG